MGRAHSITAAAAFKNLNKLLKRVFQQLERCGPAVHSPYYNSSEGRHGKIVTREIAVCKCCPETLKLRFFLQGEGLPCLCIDLLTQFGDVKKNKQKPQLNPSKLTLLMAVT